ncbi:MAG: nodulation efficiency protein D (NfeD) [Prevotellaceae bacterium]|jgi:membrane-bound ClpP family serine protease|nr:nodulation efficiency protein D (NfeD) [Prevotellaceae bacterium]
MEILIIAILIAVAIVLLLVELFLIPGTSIAGLLSGCCFVFACYFAFSRSGATAGYITLVISIVACAGAVVWFMRSKTLDHIALKEEITSTVDREVPPEVKVGGTGIAITRLALIGSAEIAGRIVEVKSSGGFLDEKTPIVVSRITDGIILVEPLPV